MSNTEEMLARLQAGVASRNDRRTLERMAESGQVDPLYLKAVASQSGKNIAPVRVDQFQAVIAQINSHIQEMADFKDAVTAEITFMRNVAKYIADNVPAMQQILIEKEIYTKEELDVTKAKVMVEAQEAIAEKKAEEEAAAAAAAAAQESTQEGNEDDRSELGGTGSGGAPGDQPEGSEEAGERSGDEAQESADATGEQGSSDAGGGGSQAA